MDNENQNKYKNYEFLLNSHTNGSIRRNRELLSFSLITLIISLSIASLLNGYSKIWNSKRSILNAKVQFEKLVNKDHDFSKLNMVQFFTFSDEEMENYGKLKKIIYKDSLHNSPKYLREVFNKEILKGTNVQTTSFISDMKFLRNARTQYLGFSLKDFSQIEGKVAPILNFQIAAPPKERLLKIISNYNILNEVEIPKSESEKISPVIEKCYSILKKIEDENKLILPILRQLLDWDQNVMNLPIDLFEKGIDKERDSFNKLAETIGIKNNLSTIYSIEGKEPNAKATKLNTASNRLISLSEERLKEMNKELSTSFQGFPINFPIKPITLIFPILICFYILVISSLRRKVAMHDFYANQIEELLLKNSGLIKHKSNSNKTLRIQDKFPITNKVISWLKEPSNSKFIILQIGIVFSFIYIIWAAFKLAFQPSMESQYKTSNYLIGITYIIVILILVASSIWVSISLGSKKNSNHEFKEDGAQQSADRQ